MKSLSEKVFPLIFWVAITFSFEHPLIAVMSIASALIHECGHLLIALLLKGGTKNIRPRINGFGISISQSNAYLTDILIVVAGPAVNLLCFLISFFFSQLASPFLELFGLLNLLTCISSLLPIEGYDGYNALSSIFELAGHGEFILPLCRLSIAFSVCACFLSVYLILRTGSGYWYFSIFFTYLLCKISKAE